MDQLTGRDPKAKSSTGLSPAKFLCHPKFRERAYRISGHPKAAYAAQVPSKFEVLQPPEKATAHSRPFMMDFDMSDMEVELRRSNIILSYQDWFLGSVLHLSEQLQSTTAEHMSAQKILHDLQEFVFSASRVGYDACQHVCHLLFNMVLCRRDAYLSDTFRTCRPPSGSSSGCIFWTTPYSSVSRHVRLRSRLSPMASNVTLLSQATWASRDSSHSSCPNPRDRQRQQQPQHQPYRPTAASHQCQPFRGKNCSLPQSSTKKGGVVVRINIDWFTDPTSLYYGTATFYPSILRRCSLRIHLVYPTLLLTRSSRTCLATDSCSWTSRLSRRLHAQPQVSAARSSLHPRNQATGGLSSISVPSTGSYALHTFGWRRLPPSCAHYS